MQSVCSITDPETRLLGSSLEHVDKSFQTYYKTLYAKLKQRF